MLDAILKEYGLEDGGAPVPCRWKYVTDVPKVQVLLFPQSEKATAAVQPANPVTPKQETANSITRFASIVSPDTILGLSKLKYVQYYRWVGYGCGHSIMSLES